MALPAIGQAEMLAGAFETVLREFLPASVAVVGCAGGNGFDRIRTDVTTRVVAADINPEYVQTVSERYAERIPGLELLVADVQASPLDCAPVDLVFAALVLEFVSPERALPHLRALCRPNGVLVVVLQLPSATVATVTPSPFVSLLALVPVMQLVPPERLQRVALDAGFARVRSTEVSLPSGKSFSVNIFRAPAGDGPFVPDGQR